ncbi:CaiB/BaiF CoA-transferase family protein [Mesorhizobium sp. J428]|uniref:CaiB/BaiF CoA transferase family protein n=1 Tax=Mesorhizobium sp. J428 TaxID=2898440 RepID=UPI002151B613|nr:CaiB/BaiF CoA-transferase family protein [Mesorhizobium sp. J428]MCR5856424.1 CoA transferase [Mesorhizobium sp. J428]
MSAEPRRGALEGVTVLDLTRLLPGAFCSQLMADMGAEVIKVEDPRGGDYNRSWEPKARTESGSFLLLNRNKKSVTLNLKSPEGHAAFAWLAGSADILLEGFRPGVMDRLGLGYEALKAENPGLIYCSLSGYGQTGPLRLAPGHDINYLGTAGALQLFGKAGEGPMVPGLSVADVGGGSLMASTGILAALYSRSVDGKGQYIDISMTDGAVAWLALHGADHLFGGIEPRGGERAWIGQAACYNIYRCADGRYVALGALEPHFWQRFCDLVDLGQDLRTHYPEGEEAARQKTALAELFLTRTRDEWAAVGESADIPLTAVNDMGEAFRHPQLAHRKMLLSVDHPVEGRVPQLGFPIKLQGTPCEIRTPPPRLGEHNEEVLGRAGYAPEAIVAMKASGAI